MSTLYDKYSPWQPFVLVFWTSANTPSIPPTRTLYSGKGQSPLCTHWSQAAVEAQLRSFLTSALDVLLSLSGIEARLPSPQCRCFSYSDVWLTAHRNSVWIRKTNWMSLFVFFIPLLIVAQHVSGNHVPIIKSWRLRDVTASCWYVL
jgi:hypothetical protein